jgi:hypothetical protein
MTQHSWYNKNRRHYGPKPNTRKARGLKRRDAGKKRFVSSIKTYDYLPGVGVDKEVEVVSIPSSMKVLKRYIKMYNYYVNRYQLYRDKKICMELVMEKFELKTVNPVKRAIKVCKYILATADK